MISFPDSHRDLLDADVATLATIGADGLPQLSEVWFLAGDDVVRLSLNASRQKVTYAFADRVGAKYGADLRTMDKPGESRVVVTVEPSRIRSWG